MGQSIFLHNCNVSITPIKNNMNLLISPTIISKFIFLWLSKTKTNKKSQWLSLLLVQNQGLNKVCSLYLGRLLWNLNWSTMTQNTPGGWEQTIKHQEISRLLLVLTPDPWCCWKHLCAPSDFSKLNILNSFHCSSVTWVLLLTGFRWLMSLASMFQGVASLGDQASDQHWGPHCRDKEN